MGLGLRIKLENSSILLAIKLTYHRKMSNPNWNWFPISVSLFFFFLVNLYQLIYRHIDWFQDMYA